MVSPRYPVLVICHLLAIHFKSTVSCKLPCTFPCVWLDIVVGWRVINVLKLRVDVFAVLYVYFFVVLPSQTERFSLFWLPRLLIVPCQIIAVGSWLFLGVPQHLTGYRSSWSLAECAGSRSEGIRYIGL